MSQTKKTARPGLAALAIALLFAVGATAGGQRTDIVAMDDWRPDSGISTGRFYCPGGELVVDPGTGMQMCSPGSRTHLRDVTYYSCIEGVTADDGAPEPRFTGVIYGDMNVNWDPEFTGAVWGSWLLVPAANCDPAVLEDAETQWVGSFQGQRTRVCDDAGRCMWVGSLRYVGRGRGELEGLQFRGSELIRTYTPFPLGYELLAILGLCPPGSCPTGPEGIFTGTIR